MAIESGQINTESGSHLEEQNWHGTENTQAVKSNLELSETLSEKICLDVQLSQTNWLGKKSEVLKNNNVVDEFRKSNELFPDSLVCYSTAFV